ncbi:serine/threonine-protein kinase [Curtobacterium sp. MCPF17_052]|uniref:serine/threonine-protein kinase n=1 Tax=Curtobacterium sp. MCPF17_052 TaxID=2175655 RepID=UPI0024E02796|nr:serine/threonine-protein kinase [Curtobacterium sp. MCPF17_052]WIB11625.1 serine/threonine-protein kinase [Curtobacterium sp. MCPF17_052]
MAEALDYIHAQGVVHRDIKPSNILLVDYGNGSDRARARLTDFGIALAAGVERLTADGVTTGTAAYLSPEQARGADVGPASDVYSLGLVLLQCFTRRREFPGSLVESALARLSRDPVVPEPLPDHWKNALAAMTAQDPPRPTGGCRARRAPPGRRHHGHRGGRPLPRTRRRPTSGTPTDQPSRRP